MLHIKIVCVLWLKSCQYLETPNYKLLKLRITWLCSSPSGKLAWQICAVLLSLTNMHCSYDLKKNPITPIKASTQGDMTKRMYQTNNNHDCVRWQNLRRPPHFSFPCNVITQPWSGLGIRSLCLPHNPLCLLTSQPGYWTPSCNQPLLSRFSSFPPTLFSVSNFILWTKSLLPFAHLQTSYFA